MDKKSRYVLNKNSVDAKSLKELKNNQLLKSMWKAKVMQYKRQDARTKQPQKNFLL